jgi:hypothetical protein
MERWMPKTTMNRFKMLFQADRIILKGIYRADLARLMRMSFEGWIGIKPVLFNNFNRLNHYKSTTLKGLVSARAEPLWHVAVKFEILIFDHKFPLIQF